MSEPFVWRCTVTPNHHGEDIQIATEDGEVLAYVKAYGDGAREVTYEVTVQPDKTWTMQRVPMSPWPETTESPSR